MLVEEPIAIDGERPIDACKRLCRAPKVILDCGAGKGSFASMFRAFYPNAKIYSCEPTTRCFDALVLNVDGQNIVCRKHAVGDKYGTATINLTANDESSSFLPSPEVGNPLWEQHVTIGSEEVQVKTIDSWLQEDGIDPRDVSILKLDLQGTELPAIAGAAEVLRYVSVVICEVWNGSGYEGCPTATQVTDALKAHGLKLAVGFTHPTGIWGDSVYVRDDSQKIRLNIGAGDTVIDGFTAIDRKFGSEAYPLNYADDSVEEIRCSHMLEHLSYQQAQEAMREWNRVLKPGGRLRISVPDVRKVIGSIDNDESWRFHLMGGQTSADDFHKSAYDDELLRAHFDVCGFDGVQAWQSPNTDTAAHPCSLNLEGFKRKVNSTLRVKAVMSIPRVGWNDAWHSISSALRPFNIQVETFNGVFWGQCMQRAFQNAVADEVDWLLCLDYDSMIRAEHVGDMLRILGENPNIDALAALQTRRGGEFPLLTVAGQKTLEVTGEPIKVATAHFGLTLIRVESLKDIPKPWFKSEPDANGEWGDARFDDDIWFWHQWRKAGKNIYVAPDVRIGHLQLMVSEFDEDMNPRHVHVAEWRKANKQ